MHCAVYTVCTNIVSVCSNWFLNKYSYWKTAFAYSISFPNVWCAIVWCGEWILIGDWISINLFAFGMSVGWKPVRNMLVINFVYRCWFLICKTEWPALFKKTREKSTVLDALISKWVISIQPAVAVENKEKMLSGYTYVYICT